MGLVWASGMVGLGWVSEGVGLVWASGMVGLGWASGGVGLVWVSGGVGLVWASGGMGLGWVDEGVGVDTVDVKVFKAEIKNEILVTRGQSHIATRGYFS